MNLNEPVRSIFNQHFVIALYAISIQWFYFVFMIKFRNIKGWTISMLAVAFTFQSCSMEKRYHSNGFNVSWIDDFSSGKSIKTNQSTQGIKKNIGKSSLSQKPSTPNYLNNNSVQENIPVDNGMPMGFKSLGQSEFPMNIVRNQFNRSKAFTPSFRNYPSSESKHKLIPSTQSKPNEKLQVQANNASRGANILLGILLIVLALYFAWNISMLLGLIIFIVAIFVMSSGRGRDRDSKNRNTENKDDKGATLVDVVYLKNGGILVGNIIEQIPNESLKIQTKDGSVFVYSMSDIARIAKEKR